MKLLVFAALFAAVTADWQQGKLYKYDVTSYTLASLQKGAASGAVLRGKLLLKPQHGGRVFVKLENPQHAQVHENLKGQNLPDTLPYRPVTGLDQVFEVQFTAGRVQWLKVPSKMSVAHENLLKGLVGSLQVDTTPERRLRSDNNFYDRHSLQGQFRKMETDVTGDCETLYTILPLSEQCKRELSHLPQPKGRIVEISKSKNYGNCARQISYHFGVPIGADWSGSVQHHNEEQFIKRATVSRIIADEDGTIYKCETKSSVYVNPLMYGKQNAEVVSNVTLVLQSVSQDDESQWQLEEGTRRVKSLLYSISHNFINVDDSSSFLLSSESNDHGENDKNQDALTRHPRSLKYRSSSRSYHRSHSQNESPTNGMRTDDRPLIIPGDRRSHSQNESPTNGMRTDDRPLIIPGDRRSHSQNQSPTNGMRTDDRPLIIPGDRARSQKQGYVENVRDGNGHLLAIPGDENHARNQMNNRKQEEHVYSASSSSSSSSEQSVDDVNWNDDLPNLNEPAYAALYMQPLAQGERKNHQAITQKLVQEIAQQMQNPNNMPKLDTLAKINVVIHHIASMSFEQLTQVSRSIEIGQGSNNNIKSDMWMVYRDCVVQAGTLPAFQQVKAWIKSKKLQNEEAAQVLGILVGTLRYPTKEVMIQFFQLAMEPEIRQQSFLNTTAILAATKFINLGHVNNETAHSRYPTHMYGRLTWRKDQFVRKEIIPVLRKELESAVQAEDSHKAQVYIRALGNLGHRAIVDVFTPYLEGKVGVSTYLRTWMINSLDMLAWQQDRRVSSILYNFLKNTAEPYEVRVAAIQNIFKGHVSQAMMQGMAEITHNDPSIHVRAAIKSVISSAAKLKNIRFMALAKSAQEAEPMLTKEEFGQQYFGKYLTDDWDEERYLGNLRIFSAVGSKNSLLPKFFEFMLWNKYDGWTAPNKLSYSVSNVQKMMSYIRKTIELQIQTHSKQQTSPIHSGERIDGTLNTKRDSFEANVHYDQMNYQRLFALSENDIRQLPQLVEQQIRKLSEGVDCHYTKIYNEDQVSIMFPIAMGVPFVYQYKQPTLIHIVGKAKGSLQRPSKGTEGISADLYKEIQITFARNLDGKAGFLDTLSDTYASAGVVNKLQINLPIKAQIQVTSRKIVTKLEFLRPDQDINLVHFSVWPYTSNQQKDTQTTIAHDPTSKLVNENNRVVTLDNTFGQRSTGMQFHLQGYSHSEDYRNIGNFFRECNFASGLLHQKDIALTHFNFKYLGTQSKTRSLILNVAYGKVRKYEQTSSAEAGKFEVDSAHSFGYENENRHQEIVNKALGGLKHAEAKYIDLNVTFDGTERSEYVLTAAMADSLVHPNIHYIVYGNRINNNLRKLEVSATGKVIKPATSSLNFLESLKRDLNLTFEWGIKIQQEQQVSDEIKIKGVKRRSQQFIEDLKDSQLGQLCMQQMAQGNSYQSACQEMVLRAHALDVLKASITYQNVSPTVKNGAYQIYRMLTHFGFWYADENINRSSEEDKIEFEGKANYTENKVNYYVLSRIGELRLENVPTPRLMGKILSTHPVFSPIERVANLYTNDQYQPFCTVDESRIETFSNRNVDYRLSDTWHVVMNASEEWQGDNRKAYITARKPSEKEQEVKILYESSNCQSVNIQLKPTQGDSEQMATVKIECDAQKVSEGRVVVYRNEKQNSNILEQYTLPDGSLLLKIDGGVLRVMYDGQRLVILPNAFRNQSLGVCGTLSGDQSDDFLIPQGMVDDPQVFGACYAITQEGSDEQMRLPQLPQGKFYTPVYRHTAILRSDDLTWRVPASSSSSSSSSSSEEDASHVYFPKCFVVSLTCHLHEQVQFFYRNGDLCLTVEKIGSCTKSCKGYGHQEQQFNVVCRPKNDRQFKMYKKLILMGQNPTVSADSKDLQQVTFGVPSGCKN